MFFLTRGECEVRVKDENKVDYSVRVLRAGSIFGEVALLVNQLRTASVRTLNYCTCSSLNKAHFIELCVRFPETVNKMKIRLLRY